MKAEYATFGLAPTAHTGGIPADGAYGARAGAAQVPEEKRDCTRDRRVLLVGPRTGLFARLAAALRTSGIGADITREAAGAHEEELRAYGALAFDRTVGEDERSAVRAALAAAHATAVCVEPLAPVVPLLAAQLEQALGPRHPGPHLLAALTAAPGEARLVTTAAARIRLTGYHRDRLRRTHAHPLFDSRPEPGEHRLPLDARIAFVVARTDGEVLVARAGRDAFGAPPPSG